MDLEVLRQRFNAKWRESPATGCWEWTASLAGAGYGQIKIPGERRQIYAHRLSYLLHKGPIDDAAYVCHRCDNPKCVNPDHLFIGTPTDNQQDRKAKDRHEYGERSNQSKLTEKQVREILHMLETGIPQLKIAKVYGIGQMTVSRIKRGERWAHVSRNKPAGGSGVTTKM